jgi:hypothetical protein
MNKTINALISSRRAAPCLFYPVVKEIRIDSIARFCATVQQLEGKDG